MVFDASTVGTGPVRRVRDFPADGERLTADAPTGMVLTFVNGHKVVEAGRLTADALSARPGELLSPATR